MLTPCLSCRRCFKVCCELIVTSTTRSMRWRVCGFTSVSASSPIVWFRLKITRHLLTSSRRNLAQSLTRRSITSARTNRVQSSGTILVQSWWDYCYSPLAGLYLYRNNCLIHVKLFSSGLCLYLNWIFDIPISNNLSYRYLINDETRFLTQSTYDNSYSISRPTRM